MRIETNEKPGYLFNTFVFDESLNNSEGAIVFIINIPCAWMVENFRIHWSTEWEKF